MIEFLNFIGSYSFWLTAIIDQFLWFITDVNWNIKIRAIFNTVCLISWIYLFWKLSGSILWEKHISKASEDTEYSTWDIYSTIAWTFALLMLSTPLWWVIWYALWYLVFG